MTNRTWNLVTTNIQGNYELFGPFDNSLAARTALKKWVRNHVEGTDYVPTVELVRASVKRGDHGTVTAEIVEIWHPESLDL